MPRHLLHFSFAFAIAGTAVTACTTTTTSTQAWTAPAYPANVGRLGWVEYVHETIRREQGNPAGGAVAGAIIGGFIGAALSGSGEGAFLGATDGALIGAETSRGNSEQRIYQIGVRFYDGGVESFLYEDVPPFQPGDHVQRTAQGLARM